jgi:hypothetical protein
MGPALGWLMRVTENLTAPHERIISGAAATHVAGVLLYSAIPVADLRRNIYALADRWDWRLVGVTDRQRASAFRSLVERL